MPLINTSGAGALIIDAELARNSWTGFYARAQPNEIADLETSGGIKWTIHDDFDFAHPVTDYDRLSVRHRRHRAGVLIAKVDKKTFVSISDGSDSLAWWPTLEVFTTNRSKAPARAEVEKARFSRLGVIDVPSGRVWLMDPCLHGADLKGRDEAIAIDIPSGRYVVECRKSDAGSYDDLFVRLRRSRSGRRSHSTRVRPISTT